MRFVVLVLLLITTLSNDHPLSSHGIQHRAAAYALTNRTKDAVDWLQKAADDSLQCDALLVRDHNLDNLRADPGFISFMQKQEDPVGVFQRQVVRRRR